MEDEGSTQWQHEWLLRGAVGSLGFLTDGIEQEDEAEESGRGQTLMNQAVLKFKLII